ncbi:MULTISPECIES: helix-turn-helix transcriptional regulator [unclassified Streptomyces]|uniref:helix-turn-helix domain-containing protein n=1 Tax=unclassified Streptomyces TaxID=2593676 RepID=UPI00344F331A
MGQQGLSLRQLGVRSGINRQVITNLIRGDSWPDVVTVSRLEDGLGVPLWPGATSCASAVAGDMK